MRVSAALLLLAAGTVAAIDTNRRTRGASVASAEPSAETIKALTEWGHKAYAEINSIKGDVFKARRCVFVAKTLATEGIFKSTFLTTALTYKYLFTGGCQAEKALCSDESFNGVASVDFKAKAKAVLEEECAKACEALASVLEPGRPAMLKLLQESTGKDALSVADMTDIVRGPSLAYKLASYIKDAAPGSVDICTAEKAGAAKAPAKKLPPGA